MTTNTIRPDVPQAGLVMARATDLSRVYAETTQPVHALDGVSTVFLAGEFTAVMGASGSGKSTLMHLLAGLDRPTAGHVQLDGQDLGSLDDEALTTLRRRRMGFVFQSFNLVPSMTALENIRLPLSFERSSDRRRTDAGYDEEWEAHLVARLDLAGVTAHRPSQLSGGQQQRVALARALLLRPAVVFADEPTGNLDIASGNIVLTLLRELSAAGRCSVVMVTHDPVAAARADRVLFLCDGRLVEEQLAMTAGDVSDRMLALAGVA